MYEVLFLSEKSQTFTMVWTLRSQPINLTYIGTVHILSILQNWDKVKQAVAVLPLRDVCGMSCVCSSSASWHKQVKI